MTYDKQIYPLIIVMTIIVLIVEGLTLFILYETSFEKQRDQLIATVRSQAALITSVANYDLEQHQQNHTDANKLAKAATLSQVREAYNNFKGFGKTGELVIGTLEGNKIKYLIRSRHRELPEHKEAPTLMGGDKAKLLQQALSKRSGTIIAKDYVGKMTLGAYEYIKPLDYGVVVKIDLDELRAPFIQVGILSIVVALILIILGAFLFRRITLPMVKHLQESGEYHRMLFESSPIGFALSSMDGMLVDINQTYANIIGRTIEETKQLTYWDITPEEYGDDEATQLEKLNTTGSYGPYEKEYIHKEGHRVPVRLSGQIIKRNNETYIWSSVENIGESKQAEQNVYLSESRLNDAQRLAKVGSWELDLLTGELIWSDEIYSIFQIDKIKFPASYDAFLNAIHPDDRESVNEAYTNSLETREPYEIVHRLKMEDGEIKYVRETCESFFAEDNKPVRSVGTVQDITEIVRSEKETEKNRARFETMFASMSDSVVLADLDRNITMVNKSVTKLFGYDESELLGKKTEMLYACPEDFKETGNKTYNVDAKGDHLPYEVEYRRKDETMFCGETSGSKILSEDGSVLGFVGIIRDITERKKSEVELQSHRLNLEELVEERTIELHDTQNELVRKERLATLGQLTATVSHELRNPLASMRPSLYVIQKLSDKGNERSQKAIERIDRNIERCDHIIDELLDFTRITDLNINSISFDVWLDSVIEEQVVPEGISLKKEYGLSNVKLDIDRDKLRRAIINVFDNGCHAMMDDSKNIVDAENAQVEIKTRMNNDYIEIVISDTGKGIPKDVLDKIYEPLFSTKGFGVGLGMSVVKQIIEQHKGHVEIETKENIGTSVIFKLPIN